MEGRFSQGLRQSRARAFLPSVPRSRGSLWEFDGNLGMYIGANRTRSLYPTESQTARGSRFLLHLAVYSRWRPIRISTTTIPDDNIAVTNKSAIDPSSQEDLSYARVSRGELRALRSMCKLVTRDTEKRKDSEPHGLHEVCPSLVMPYPHHPLSPPKHLKSSRSFRFED